MLNRNALRSFRLASELAGFFALCLCQMQNSTTSSSPRMSQSESFGSGHLGDESEPSSFVLAGPSASSEVIALRRRLAELEAENTHLKTRHQEKLALLHLMSAPPPNEVRSGNPLDESSFADPAWAATNQSAMMTVPLHVLLIEDDAFQRDLTKTLCEMCNRSRGRSSLSP